MSLGTWRPRVLIVLAGCLVAAVAIGFAPYFRRDQPSNAPSEPLFEGLGPHRRKVTTTSPAAQLYFDQGLAFCAQNRVVEAKVEAEAFRMAAPFPRGTAYRYTPGPAFLKVAQKTLAGHILFRQGKLGEAIEVLKTAIDREDRLPYSEPPDWFEPVRQALASVFLNANRDAEAEAVCREDLARHPENGCSLFELAQSLLRQKKTKDADAVSARLKQVWQHADVKLTSQCLGIPAKG